MSPTDKRPDVAASTAVMTVLVLLATCCRFMSRKMSGAGYWFDDWVVLIAVCGALSVNIITFILVADGEGKHAADLPSDATRKVLYHDYITEIAIHFSVVVVKFSFLLLYGRIFARRTFRNVLWTIAMLIGVWGVASIVTLIFQCTPIRKTWHEDVNGHCIDLQKFLYGQSIPDVVFDIVLLLLPFAFITKLQMGPSHRIALSAVFLLGLLTIIFSVLRLVFFARLQLGDFPWSRTEADLFSVLEVNVGIIVSCLMTSGPLFKATLTRAGLNYNISHTAASAPGLITIGSRGIARSRAHRPHQSDFTGLESSMEPAVENAGQMGLTRHAHAGSRAESPCYELDKIYVRKDVKVEERSQMPREEHERRVLDIPEPPPRKAGHV